MCIQNESCILDSKYLCFYPFYFDILESIWHTELDFLVPHRDRLVILSFTTSPYQNNSIQEENFIKHYQHERPTFIDEDDDELAHTHLIEKFHSGSFDENDYFDTHEKLENERTTSSITIPSPPPSASANVSNSGRSDMSKTVATTPNNILTNIEANEKQTYGIENVGIHMNGNNRKQHARTRNRNNGTTGGRGMNRKYSNANKDRSNDNVGATMRKEKNNRRGDDLRENFEIKVNNKLELDKSNDDFGDKSVQSVVGGNNNNNNGNGGNSGVGTKLQQRKYVTKINPTDELPPDNEYEINGNRKTSIVRDSNIHIVKPSEGNTFVPSTPFSTDSKIIEIRPSTMRVSKRYKRSSETIDTRMQIESDRIEDEFGDLDDDDVREPRIYVNFENTEQYTENEDNLLLKPAPDAVAAALIDTAVPANVTPITATTSTPKQLHGFAACLQHYLNVNKEIGMIYIYI